MRLLKYVKGFIFGVGRFQTTGPFWLETVSRHYLRLSLLDGCFSILAGKLNKINPEPWIVVRRKWKNVNFPSGNNHRSLWTVQCVLQTYHWHCQGWEIVTLLQREQCCMSCLLHELLRRH